MKSKGMLVAKFIEINRQQLRRADSSQRPRMHRIK
jgi:hypothetical protein